jgi:class 3 adenylate cyclase
MHLRDTADEIANGNFNARSAIKSGDEIEQLSISFDIMAKKIQNSLKEIMQKDKVIKEQRDLLLEFSESKQKCCVGIIDIVNSTKITANLSNKGTSNFYGIFINFMASIIKEFGGVVVKNIGDALLFYFPETNINDKQSFENVIDCCMKMIDSHSKINSKMDEKGLSSLSYRISAVYGPIMIGQMSTSSVVDIFGSTVNVCTKINSLASPNGLVIGEDLYSAVKSHEKFIFKEKTNYVIDDTRKIKVYSVEDVSHPKLTNFINTTSVTSNNYAKKP